MVGGFSVSEVLCNDSIAPAIYGEHIFRPELECIAVLVYYLGTRIDKNDLIMKMVGCDFHLDAIEKVKIFNNHEFDQFVNHLQTTFLNPEHIDYIGRELLEEFKDQCSCCK